MTDIVSLMDRSSGRCLGTPPKFFLIAFDCLS